MTHHTSFPVARVTGPSAFGARCPWSAYPIAGKAATNPRRHHPQALQLRPWKPYMSLRGRDSETLRRARDRDIEEFGLRVPFLLEMRCIGNKYVIELQPFQQ